MRWTGRRESDNVEDQRGRSPRGVVGGGIGLLVIALVVWLLGGDPMQLLQQMPVDNQSTVSTQRNNPEEDKLARFVSVVLADTEDAWTLLFQQTGRRYREPKLVLFTDAAQSACGHAAAATGPFYCPADEKVYLDLSFFRELQERFQAPGDFAMAYVIAHEVGHHVQKLLGITDKVMAMQGRLSEQEFNSYLVRLELQADFFSGVWAHHAQRLSNILEPGDIEEALNAASAVGDDRIQKKSRGYVVPDAFTHGTSAQRMRWFKKGFDTGDISQGDTFSAQVL
jgi:predicted metalloprotease